MENYQVFREYDNMILHYLAYMGGLTINLISETHYEFEMKKHCITIYNMRIINNYFCFLKNNNNYFLNIYIYQLIIPVYPQLQLLKITTIVCVSMELLCLNKQGKMQNQPSKFLQISFQSSKFTFIYFSPLTFKCIQLRLFHQLLLYVVVNFSIL